MRKSKKSTSSLGILTVILLILILIAGALIAIKFVKENKTIGSANVDNSAETKEEVLEEPKTFAGNERPIAFMIDNNINAMPQAGLLEADLVYEIIVEGGETRLMAVIKNKNIDQIGPLRSARHYFIDYALENDAIYIHYGQSPQAKADLESLKVDHINGIYESTTNFWRVSSRYAPHNAVTSTKRLDAMIKSRDFKTTSNNGSVLNYVAKDFDLEDIKEEKEVQTEEGTTSIEEKVTNIANKVTIPYSAYNTVKYIYDAETKTYIRYSRDKKQTDWNSGETVFAKNIIITKCKNTTLNDGTNTGRQTLDNIKTLDGYYITNGKYIPIKCQKTSRSGKTVYEDLNGNEIKVNDGKTFIQICPIDSKIKFE